MTRDQILYQLFELTVAAEKAGHDDIRLSLEGILTFDLTVPEAVAGPGFDAIDAAAAELGRRGGQATSAVKTEAARQNGAKGGRPRS